MALPRNGFVISAPAAISRAIKECPNTEHQRKEINNRELLINLNGFIPGITKKISV